MPKTVLPSKFQEWKGLDRISTVVHEMKCIFREITKDDFGLDGEIEVVVPKQGGQGYETTGGIIKVQAKSGESYVKQDTDASFVTPVEKSDLEGWHNAPYPVLFIVYHPHDDRLYYKEIKSYVKNTPGVFKPPLRVTFDKVADEFDAGKYEKIIQASAVSPPRISLDQREKVFSNLLLVKREPKTIFVAPTEYKDFTHVRSEITGFAPPFTVTGGTLFTLANLHDERSVLRGFCDIGSIDSMPASKWAKDESYRNEYIFLLNQLLGAHLRRCGLIYNRHFKRNFFPRRNDTDEVFREDWYNVRTSRAAPPRIVAKYYKYRSARFWRHLAVNLSFKCIGSSWFLQIVPKYFFTTDGETPWDSDLVGPYTTKIKSDEWNNHVLNHVLFWTDVLSLRKPTIELSLFYKTVMIIEKVPISGIANFAIPNDPALYEDDAGQLEFFSAESAETDSEEDENDEY
jgi:Domain of unknown function (DUF4365)